MKSKKKAVSFLSETSHRRDYQRGMGLISVAEDEANLNKRSSKLDSYKSIKLNDSDFYMDSESSEIHGSPQYEEFEDVE